MGLKSVSLKWAKRNEYTRWRPRIDRGADFTSYHFRTLHLTIEKAPKVYEGEDARCQT